MIPGTDILLKKNEATRTEIKNSNTKEEGNQKLNPMNKKKNATSEKGEKRSTKISTDPGDPSDDNASSSDDEERRANMYSTKRK